MGAFDDAIAAGLAAAESAWGVSFTILGIAGTFTGTFDRHRDEGAPSVGGYLPQVDASVVASRSQFSGIASEALLLEDGTELLLENGAALELEGDDDANLPAVGKRLTVQGKQYLITAIEDDGHAFSIYLRSVHR